MRRASEISTSRPYPAHEVPQVGSREHAVGLTQLCGGLGDHAVDQLGTAWQVVEQPDDLPGSQDSGRGVALDQTR